MSNRFEILHRARQYHCRTVFKSSKRLKQITLILRTNEFMRGLILRWASPGYAVSEQASELMVINQVWRQRPNPITVPLCNVAKRRRNIQTLSILHQVMQSCTLFSAESLRRLLNKELSCRWLTLVWRHCIIGEFRDRQGLGIFTPGECVHSRSMTSIITDSWAEK